MKPDRKNTLLYMLKCILGGGFCYLLYVLFPHYPLYWGTVAALLVFSPDGDTNKDAWNRMAANIIGAFTGFLMHLPQLPPLLMVCLGIGATILLCSVLNLISVARSALAAFVIVMTMEAQGKSWHVAAERVVCVIIGCAAAMLVTFIFSRLANTRDKHKHSPAKGHKQ